MERIALDLARNQISASYRDEIKQAAGDDVLDAREQRLLSPWAKEVVAKLGGGKSVKTEEAADQMEGKVRRALTAVASNHRTITRNDVEKLKVADLRAKVIDLFPAKNTDTAKLKAAVAASDIKEMTDYNKGFTLQDYGPSASLRSIAADLTGMDDEPEDSIFDFKKGAAGVKAFAEQAREQGKSDADDAEDEPLANQLRTIHNNVAKEVQALFGDKSKFSEIHYHYNGIVEDGATEYSILAGKRKDGGWTVIMYSNFPF